MGSNEDASEKPIHRVTIKPFAIGKYPITVREWNECAAAKACGFTATGKDDAPVTNVSWSDAKQYAAWLAEATRKPYRLPSEAEWEFAARGGTQTKYWWGDQLQPGMANCKDCGAAPDSGIPAVAGPGPLGKHEQIPSAVQQLVQVPRGALVEAAPAPVHRHGVEQQRHQRSDEPVLVEVVRRGGDRGALADAPRKRRQDHGRVDVAAVVRDQDHGSTQPRKLLATGCAPADVEVHRRLEHDALEHLAHAASRP